MFDRFMEGDVEWLARYRAGTIDDVDDNPPEAGELLERAQRALRGQDREPKSAVVYAIIALQTPEERRNMFESLVSSSADRRCFLDHVEQLSLDEQLRIRQVTDVEIISDRAGASPRPHESGFRIELGLKEFDFVEELASFGKKMDIPQGLVAFGHEFAHTFDFRLSSGKPEIKWSGRMHNHNAEVRAELFSYLWLEKGSVREEIERLIELHLQAL